MITEGVEVKEDLEELIQERTLKKEIYENIVYNEIESHNDSIWSFFLFSGNLTVEKTERVRGRLYCDLKIPNIEVQYLYEEIIMSWFRNSIKNKEVDLLFKSLIEGDIETFELLFKKFVLNSMSIFDTGAEPEKVYHAFVLGMLVYLNNEYEIKSNRESGYGRYDVMMIPRNKENAGIILEFKKVRKNETLKEAAEKALDQINDRKYRQELLDREIIKIIELGLAFEGKNVLILERKIQNPLDKYSIE